MAVRKVAHLDLLCSDCGDDLSEGNWISNSKRKSGISNICSTCSCIRQGLWQINNKDKVAAKARRARLKKYGITEKIYQETLEKQGNSCKICKSKGKNKSLPVDHCHKTGKFRGILCIKCNTLLGNANDDIRILKEAINYLKESRK